MIPISREEAETVFWNDWKERQVWIGAFVLLGDDAKEQHNFWSLVVDITGDKLALAGKYASVEVPIDGAILEYGEPTEAPLGVRERFSVFDRLFTIRSPNVAAFLFGSKPTEG